MPKTRTSFQVQHGGEAAIKDLEHGEPFSPGPVLDKQHALETRVKEPGAVAAIMTENAIRLQAVADTFYDCIATATQTRDIVGLDRYAQRYLWSVARACQQWERVLELQRHNQGEDYEKIITQEQAE